MSTDNDNSKQETNNYYEPENINYNFDTYPSNYCPMCSNYRFYNEPANEPIIDDYEDPDEYEYLDIEDDSFYRQGGYDGGYGRPRRRRRRRRHPYYPYTYPYPFIFPFIFPFGGYDDDWDEY